MGASIAQKQEASKIDVFLARAAQKLMLDPSAFKIIPASRNR
jgi:menaquinone-dependent protoporphyrinogen IX oxidase